MGNSKCTYLKQKFNKTLECKKQKKIINIKECNSCEYKEFANSESIKKRTYKQSKKEKNRYSILYNDLSKCCVEGCLTPYYCVEKNEVYEGAKRSASIKYGFVCSFCQIHHDQFHNNREFALLYKKCFKRNLKKLILERNF